jgi:hypothetical protein
LSELFKWGGRKGAEPEAAPAAAAPPPDTLTTSKVFPRFMAALAPCPAPVLIDLGPVIGVNIAYFGERLACKIFVEDFLSEIESHARRGGGAGLADTLIARLVQAPGTIDGILCWDVFDFLDRSVGQLVASRLTKLLRPGGALYGLFGTTPVELANYTRFIVDGDDTLRMRPYPATRARRNVWLTRELNKMFDGLVVAESVLLKTGTRETLFRKPQE